MRKKQTRIKAISLKSYFFYIALVRQQVSILYFSANKWNKAWFNLCITFEVKGHKDHKMTRNNKNKCVSIFDVKLLHIWLRGKLQVKAKLRILYSTHNLTKTKIYQYHLNTETTENNNEANECSAISHVWSRIACKTILNLYFLCTSSKWYICSPLWCPTPREPRWKAWSRCSGSHSWHSCN